MSTTDADELHGGFADAEEAESVAPMVAFLEHVEAIPEFVAYKAELRQRLGLRQGHAVVDVGCGVGAHVNRIAAEHDGPVVGLDRPAMLTHARERARANGVRWVAGDAQALPLPEAAFDACLVERVLKYLPRPALALAEIARVLRPAGTVAAFELDYDSLTLGGNPRVADAVKRMLRDSVAQPRMGRQLPILLAEAGLVGVTSRAVAFIAPWPVHDMIVRYPTRRAVEQGTLSADPTSAWLAEQEHPDALTSIHLGVLATARRPGTRS